VIVDRDNDSASGANAEDENLMPAWAAAEKTEGEVEKPAPDIFHSSEEPRRGLEPLRIGLVQDRFEYLNGRNLVKEEKIVQRGSIAKFDCRASYGRKVGTLDDSRLSSDAE
jgi:hypothetical protein